MTVKEAIGMLTASFAKMGIPTPQLDSEVLLSEALQCERYQLYAQDENVLTDEQIRKIYEYKQRRKNGEPVAYIVGKKEFYSLEFYVDFRVLIPRPETELIVDLAISHSRHNARVLDIGTGCGCIAIALKYNRLDCEVFASDISFDALQVAQLNCEKILGKGTIHFFQGDIFCPCGEKKFDVIVSNPPYIGYENKNSLCKEIFFEPSVALYCGDGGKEIIYRIIDGAYSHIRDGGTIILEIGDGMCDEILSCAKSKGYWISVFNDYGGLPRAVLLKK